MGPADSIEKDCHGGGAERSYRILKRAAAKSNRRFPFAPRCRDSMVTSSYLSDAWRVEANSSNEFWRAFRLYAVRKTHGVRMANAEARFKISKSSIQPMPIGETLSFLLTLKIPSLHWIQPVEVSLTRPRCRGSSMRLRPQLMTMIRFSGKRLLLPRTGSATSFHPVCDRLILIAALAAFPPLS